MDGRTDRHDDSIYRQMNSIDVSRCAAFVGLLPFNEEIVVNRRKRVPFGEYSR